MATSPKTEIPRWILVHNEGFILTRLYTKGQVNSNFTIFDADTEAEIDAEIQRLGLTVKPRTPRPTT